MMSARQAAQYTAIAEQYDEQARRFEPGSLGSVGNRMEASKYHDLAARALSWPDPAEGKA